MYYLWNERKFIILKHFLYVHTKISIARICLQICVSHRYFNTRPWLEHWNFYLIYHLFDCIAVPNLLQTIDLRFQVGSSYYET